MNGTEQLVYGLREGLANPLISFLARGFGYQPSEGEYSYWLSWPVQVLSSGGSTQPIPMSVSQDAGFLWESIVGFHTGEYSFTLRESGKEITFMPNAITSTMGVGTGARPCYPSLKPYWFRPNTTITVQFADLSGEENTIYFALAGRRAKTDPGAFAYTQGSLARFAGA
jgi:hypothetical protein